MLYFENINNNCWSTCCPLIWEILRQWKPLLLFPSPISIHIFISILIWCTLFQSHLHAVCFFHGSFLSFAYQLIFYVTPSKEEWGRKALRKTDHNFQNIIQNWLKASWRSPQLGYPSSQAYKFPFQCVLLWPELFMSPLTISRLKMPHKGIHHIVIFILLFGLCQIFIFGRIGTLENYAVCLYWYCYYSTRSSRQDISMTSTIFIQYFQLYLAHITETGKIKSYKN